jgi:hypothetical protein
VAVLLLPPTPMVKQSPGPPQPIIDEPKGAAVANEIAVTASGWRQAVKRLISK